VRSALDQSISCRTRELVLLTLHTYIPAVRDLKNYQSDAYVCFWNGVRTILLEGSSCEVAPKMWKHGLGVEEMFRLLEAGLSGGDVESNEDICGAVESLLTSIRRKVPRKVDKKLKKLESSILKLCGAVN
jgi:hypothetical protein